MNNLETINTFNGHVGRVWSAAFHPVNENVLASCGEDKKIRIWIKSKNPPENNKQTWITKTILQEGHTRTIRDLSWSPCGKYLASASFDATTSIWENSSNDERSNIDDLAKSKGEFECNATLEGHESEVKSVAWSKSGTFIATCSRDKTVWIWEIMGDGEFECVSVLLQHTQDVKKVIWHPTEDILVSCSYDNTINFYEEDKTGNDWTCTQTLTGHTSTVWSITFDKTGDRLASCSDDRMVKIWQMYRPGNEEGIVTPNGEPIWKCICTLSGLHTRTVYDIDWCKQTGLLATACGDDMIRIFKESSTENPGDRKEITFEMIVGQHYAHSQDVNRIIWNPHKIGELLSCSDDGVLKLWKFNFLV